MKVELQRINDSQHFRAKNEKGHTVELSGDGNAVGPMESVLMAAAGCSTIDIVLILERMRQPLDDIRVVVDGTRRDEVPRIFTAIHLHYILKGDLKESKVKKAIDLSLDKYCSVSMMLEAASIEITSSFEIEE